MRRLLASVAVVLAAILPAPAWAASAAPAECVGVWVVVDATALDGGITTTCANRHATGTEALASAGVEVARSGGMLCQLDGRPERCEISAGAYWSYWQATPSGDSYGGWSYATLGADRYIPRGGDAEGWVFGDGRTPPASLPETLAAASATEPVDTTATPSAGSVETTPAPSVEPAGPSGPAAATDGGSPLSLLIVLGVLVVAAAAWLGTRLRRR